MMTRAWRIAISITVLLSTLISLNLCYEIGYRRGESAAWTAVLQQRAILFGVRGEAGPR